MVYFQAPAFPGDSARRELSYDEVLQGLFEYFVTPETVFQVLRLLEYLRAQIAERHLRQLGAAYARVYRAPTYRNCRRLTQLEGEARSLFDTLIFDSYTYFSVLRERLEDNFAGLANHPVFQNPGLRRRLLKLRSRSLTLFFAPQLIRDGSNGDARVLQESFQALADSDWYEPLAVLHFLRRAYRVNGERHVPRLLGNHLAVLYRRIERCKHDGRDIRSTSRALGRAMKLLDKPFASETMRKKIARTVQNDHHAQMSFDASFALWLEMVAGTRTYSLRALTYRMS